MDWASPFILLIALFGIPAAGCVALVLSLQIPRFIYGQSVPLLRAAEIGSLITVLVLLLVLRACLALPSAPSGFYRNVLDFLAMARWHPSVKAALVGLMVLPPTWLIYTDHFWLVTMLQTRGRRALMLGDVQSGLDSIAVVYQLALTGGVPLLFTLHMLSRSKARGAAAAKNTEEMLKKQGAKVEAKKYGDTTCSTMILQGAMAAFSGTNCAAEKGQLFFSVSVTAGTKGLVPMDQVRALAEKILSRLP